MQVPTLKLQKVKNYDGWETVLVVDEDRFVRNLLKRTLALHGYQVLTAADSLEAQKIAREHPGSIHLMISDVLLSITDGPELARILSHDRPDLRTLYVSGFYRAIVSRSVTPDEQFLVKPFSPDELLKKVRTVIEMVSAA